MTAMCWNTACRKKGTVEAWVWESGLCSDCYNRAERTMDRLRLSTVGFGDLGPDDLLILHISNSDDGTAVNLVTDTGAVVASLPFDQADGTSISAQIVRWTGPRQNIAILGFPIAEVRDLIEAEALTKRARADLDNAEGRQQAAANRLGNALANEKDLKVGDVVKVTRRGYRRTVLTTVVRFGEVVRLSGELEGWKGAAPTMSVSVAWLKKDGTRADRRFERLYDEWEKVEKPNA